MCWEMTAICSGLPAFRAPHVDDLRRPLTPALMPSMGSKSREYMFGATVRHLAERAEEARLNADVAACQAWNARMLAFQGRLSRPLRSATRSTPAIATSK